MPSPKLLLRLVLLISALALAVYLALLGAAVIKTNDLHFGMVLALATLIVLTHAADTHLYDSSKPKLLRLFTKWILSPSLILIVLGIWIKLTAALTE